MISRNKLKLILYLVLLVNIFTCFTIYIYSYRSNNESDDKHVKLHPNDCNNNNKIVNYNPDINNIINYLHDLNAFVIDISILNELYTVETSKYLNIEFEDIFKQIDNDNQSSSYITFGIFENDLNNVYIRHNLKCKLSNLKGKYLDKIVTTNLYIQCKSYKIQLAVFYRRHNFYWVGSHDDSSQKSRWFGDVPRAVQDFKLRTIENAKKQQLNIPNDLHRFLYDYGHSKFLECNRTMADHNYKLSEGRYKQNLTRNNRTSVCFKHVLTNLEKMNKRFWLAGGTLLGWYRDCGVIPHTTDADFAMYIDEYDKALKESFLGNKTVRIWMSLGLRRSNFELRMSGCGFAFDIFFSYKQKNNTVQCNYFHVTKVYKQCFPIFTEICSGELLNAKFMIPCDPVQYLTYNYGKMEKWMTPESKNYSLANMEWKDGEPRSINDLPYSFRYYDEFGRRRVDLSLKSINKFYSVVAKKNLTTLPNDDDDYI